MRGARYVHLIPWTLHSGSEHYVPKKRENKFGNFLYVIMSQVKPTFTIVFWLSSMLAANTNLC
jgi:hypothetical protein